MDQQTADKIDALFGFASTWTFLRGARCHQRGQTINIDLDQIKDLHRQTGLPSQTLEAFAIFVMGHEKGHAVQDRVPPERDYGANARQMELEADMIGAWVLLNLCGKDAPQTLEGRLNGFNDINAMAQPAGGALGQPTGSSAQNYPWPEQREMALVRGPTLAAAYTAQSVQQGLAVFADDVMQVAKEHVDGL